MEKFADGNILIAVTWRMNNVMASLKKEILDQSSLIIDDPSSRTLSTGNAIQVVVFWRYLDGGSGASGTL